MHCFSFTFALCQLGSRTSSESCEHHGRPDLYETFTAAADSENESDIDVEYAADDFDFHSSNAGDLDCARSRIEREG